MGIKNLWSLNIDELLVADQLKYQLKKNDYEVFFPLNSQMKNIDLILLNLKNNKAVSLQVKGSRTYSPSSSQAKRYGEGAASWFSLKKEHIFKPQNKINYYIFVLHSFQDGELKKQIQINYLIIPERKFKDLSSQKAVRRNGYYHYFIWIDPINKRCFEFNNKDGRTFDLSKYIDNWKSIK